MKTIEEMHDSLDRWYDEGLIGNIIFYRSPGSQGAEAIIEQVIKAREMKPETRAAFEMFMDGLNVERGEVVRDKDGNPDRVKLTRRFDCA